MRRGFSYIAVLLVCLFLPACLVVRGTVTSNQSSVSGEEGKVLRHIVLLKFKSEATPAQIREVENAFRLLPQQISEVDEFEWGIETSARNLSKGFTHGGVFTFDTEASRDAYRDHPAHVAFAELAQPIVEELFVFDYWAQD